MTDALERQLTSIVGPGHVLTDAATRAAYDADWTGRFNSPSRLVVRPATTGEVAAVVEACATAQVAIVPQGGNTGLVGGGVPRAREVVVSLRRLDAIGPVDAAAGSILVGAGTTLAAVQAAASAQGLDFGIDMASRDSATVGGMIATNAGGIRVVRHGPMRAQVCGIEVVLADGSVVSRLSGLAQDAGGYDLAGLLTGSEGTLAIVTRASLRLVPPTGPTVVALVGVADTRAALHVAAAGRAAGPLEAVEIFYADGLRLVCAHAGLRPPLAVQWPAYVLVELSGYDAEDRLGALLTRLSIEDAAVAVARDDQRRLWAYRERLADAIAARGVPHKLDVALPHDRLEEFVAAVHPLVRSLVAAAECVVFGHVGVGNLHVNLLGIDPGDARADDAVLGLVAELGGSIGAEHGIGIAKTAWLPRTRSAADIAAMRAVKDALDPAGILNPGVLFPVNP